MQRKRKPKYNTINILYFQKNKNYHPKGVAILNSLVYNKVEE